MCTRYVLFSTVLLPFGRKQRILAIVHRSPAAPAPAPAPHKDPFQVKYFRTSGLGFKYRPLSSMLYEHRRAQLPVAVAVAGRAHEARGDRETSHTATCWHWHWHLGSPLVLVLVLGHLVLVLVPAGAGAYNIIFYIEVMAR
jgi:hypothetical protein